MTSRMRCSHSPQRRVQKAVAACGIRFCVSSAETGANFATRGVFFGCGAVARPCRLSAVFGLKPPERLGDFTLFSAWSGAYHARIFSSKTAGSIAFLLQKRTMQQCRRLLSVSFIQQCNTNTLAMLQSSFWDRPHPFRTDLLGDDFGDILFCLVHSSA